MKMAITEVTTNLPVIKVAFLDVGQGDTIVISCSETHEAFVVDCIDAGAVLEYLRQEQIRYFRGVIVTHLHADHYKYVADLLNNYTEVPGLGPCEVLIYNDFLNQKDQQRLLSDED
jgi:beta-lactamase superfamily II metal-dependent hydrolase